MHKDDRENTAFTTPWCTFMYDKIPFGLMNAGANFQRDMDIAFAGEKDKFIVIYLNDLTFFSNSYEDHLKHLSQMFLKCKNYGLSLNPKKSHFAMQEGNYWDTSFLRKVLRLILTQLKQSKSLGHLGKK